jgi:hypothetical protein
MARALDRACVIVKCRADTNHDRVNPVSMRAAGPREQKSLNRACSRIQTAAAYRKPNSLLSLPTRYKISINYINNA